MSDMEFWGVEVKSGEPLTVSPGDGMILHLSQANIGELKKQKGNESLCLFVTIGGKKLVLGTLYTDKLPQQQFDLVFERDFELSHNWKRGSVFFYGYKANTDSSDSEEDIPLNVANNGKQESKAKQKSAEAAKEKRADAGKQKVSSSEEDTEEDGGGGSEDSSDSFDAVSDESEEETPKKAETSKKRSVEPASKTPVPDKKAKVTPQSADGKKGSVHVDTPHPAKKAGKTPANKSNQQTPKSGGSHSCNSCNRAFGTEKALESHSKAKHGGGK
ncbi:histone deacetylase hdt1 [Phtheirospermum japonicum]|uniref:Histone deacetylase hdt1 n=1 Tax=Phtheirospermum japonicum TaxID=374723 RepID=A0A830BQP9_9LAMI|nr:histone deacetylase hdt1 [Phtheirospermum japonicum]